MRDYSYKIIKGNVSYVLQKIPNRKRIALCKCDEEKNTILPIAYFFSEEEAYEWEDFICDIVEEEIV